MPPSEYNYTEYQTEPCAVTYLTVPEVTQHLDIPWLCMCLHKMKNTHLCATKL